LNTCQNINKKWTQARDVVTLTKEHEQYFFLSGSLVAKWTLHKLYNIHTN